MDISAEMLLVPHRWHSLLSFSLCRFAFTETSPSIHVPRIRSMHVPPLFMIGLTTSSKSPLVMEIIQCNAWSLTASENFEHEACVESSSSDSLRSGPLAYHVLSNQLH
jgi:hypothetical protein